MEVMQNVGPERHGWAALSLLLWSVICLWAWHRHRKPSRSNEATVLVAFASQTGTAEALARSTLAELQSLIDIDQRMKLLPLNSIKRSDLQRSRRLLLIVSTTGQGVAPENARQFVRRFMHSSLDLGHLEYGLLGLGDRRYKQFCAFADSLDEWLLAQGAKRSWAPIKVDRNDPRTLEQWRQNLELIPQPFPSGNP